ncbi:MAG: hypothetical protein AAF383_18670 [Cyanobacteria bacterium P01_A01_bin.83]
MTTGETLMLTPDDYKQALDKESIRKLLDNAIQIDTDTFDRAFDIAANGSETASMEAFQEALLDLSSCGQTAQLADASITRLRPYLTSRLWC